MSDQTVTKDYRGAIERELAERLAAPRPKPAPAAGPKAVPDVALLCLACRGISAGDAQFCTSCGERFNALVIAPRGRAGEDR